MREHEIRQDELISEAIIVPAGVVHLVKLQREGFAYIKP
jgi:intracellular sulfur oxidation DsrE/DsrF family protein